MQFEKESPPEKLYKFVHSDRLDVLSDLKIRFTQPSALNDPFELRPMFEKFAPEDRMDEFLNPPLDLVREELEAQYQRMPNEFRKMVTMEEINKKLTENPELIRYFWLNLARSYCRQLRCSPPEQKLC